MIRNLFFLSIFLLSIYSFSQNDKRSNFLGAHFGSLGTGLNYTHNINERFDASITLSYFNANIEKTTVAKKSETHSLRNFNTKSGSFLINWYYSKKSSAVCLTGGVYYQLTRLSETREYFYNVSPDSEDKESIGTVSLAFSSKPFSPYLGLTFGEPYTLSRVSVALDLGVLYHGRPIVDFKATDRLSQTAEQQWIIEDNVKNYNFYPVANLRINVKLSK
jgi:hypothetical protein